MKADVATYEECRTVLGGDADTNILTSEVIGNVFENPELLKTFL